MTTTDGLAPLEQKLVDCVERGEELDLADGELVNEAAMQTWDLDRTLSADVLRRIIRGKLAKEADPHGLRLRGARIRGRLDLDTISSSVALELDDCLLEEGLTAEDANLPRLVLTGCRLHHPSEAALNANRLTTALLRIDRATITAHTSDGAVVLRGARIGLLSCQSAKLRNDNGPAIHADNLHVEQNVFLRNGFEATGSGGHGAVRLLGAQVGSLECDGARLRNDTGPALYADAMKVDRGVFLRNGFEAISSSGLGTVRLHGARIGGQLNCQDARLRNNIGPALHAENIHVAQAVLLRYGFEAIGGGEWGTVRFLGAKVGTLECDGARLRNDTGPALAADGIKVDRNVFLHKGFEATGSGELGTVRLLGAQLGSLECDGARLRNDTGPALHADGIKVDRGVFLREGFEAIGIDKTGAVRLLSAHIGGQLSCQDARLRNDIGPALHAENMHVERTVFLRGRFDAVGGGELGTIRLLGAQIDGQLNCERAKLRNDTGPALYADGLHVEQNLSLRNRFDAVGGGELGTIRLLGAHIGGQLNCERAKLRNDTGPAFYADGLHVEQNLFFRNRFEAIGSGNAGAVRLLGAQLGSLECDGARLRNDTGPALHADGIKVDRSVFLRNGFEAVGNGELGAVRLLSAHVGGQLSYQAARLRNDTGPALQADHLVIERKLFLHEGFEAVGSGTGAVVNLSNVRIGGALVFNPARLEHRRNPSARLNLDGLVYSGLPTGLPVRDWLSLLRNGTVGYAAQPYQQLAAAYRSAGHDREARRILIAQRRDQLRRASTSRRERVWGRFTGLTLGYGYQPWRALLGLVLVIATAVILAFGLGAHGGLAQVRNPPPPTPVECTWVENLSVGFDLGTPLIPTGARTRCQPTGSATGQALDFAGMVLRLLAWAFATLFIAGFTGAVRKT